MEAVVEAVAAATASNDSLHKKSSGRIQRYMLDYIWDFLIYCFNVMKRIIKERRIIYVHYMFRLGRCFSS